jgi:hypothetical protein
MLVEVERRPARWNWFAIANGLGIHRQRDIATRSANTKSLRRGLQR